MAYSSSFSRSRSAPVPASTRWITLAVGLLAGYLVGMVLMETADVMFTSRIEHAMPAATQSSGTTQSTTTATQTLVAAPATTTALQTTASQSPKTDGQPAGDTIHSLLTSNGSPYQNFQGRIMYGTYKLVQAMPGGEKLTGFTRVLHRTKVDEYVQEIPTFRADPLHPECDNYCDFPVADRANAVVQWLAAVKKDPSMVKGQWILLLESDYVWMKPLQAPDAASSAPGLQYHFDYINVNYPTVVPIIERLLNGAKPAGGVPNSGPAPVLLRLRELEIVAPDWERLTAAIEADAGAVKALGWVREMYAWSVAVALHPEVKMLTQEPFVSPLIVQPPHEDHFGNASICHYTWGAIYNDSTHTVYRWEKRDFTSPQVALKVPKIPLPPQPFQPNTWHLQGNEPVTETLHTTLTAMLTQMNKAIDTLADLTGSAALSNRRMKA